MRTRPSRSEGISRLLTVIVTNGTKIVGLVIGLKANGNPYTLAFAALCVMGGQVGEGVLLGVIERFFAMPPQEDPRD